jgi:hypothetical protein
MRSRTVMKWGRAQAISKCNIPGAPGSLAVDALATVPFIAIGSSSSSSGAMISAD